MKKIHILSISVLSSALFIGSCQQPEADQATIDAKVTEAYNAEKTKVENEAATACEDAINAKVKSVQDSMASMNAAQQAAHLAKIQKDLKLKQAKADAAKKKAQADAKKKPVVKTPTKTSAEIEKDRKANSMGSGENATVKVTKEQTQQKANSMGSGEAAPIKVTEEQTKSKASKMGSGN